MSNPQIHLTPRNWAGTTTRLSTHGASLHELTLFHQGRELPKWIMKSLYISERIIYVVSILPAFFVVVFVLDVFIFLLLLSLYFLSLSIISF